MGGVVCLEEKSVRKHALNKTQTYSVVIILHLHGTIVCVLGICRHAMIGNMGSVVKLCSRLHLNRLHEINKKKKLITRIDALFHEVICEGEGGGSLEGNITRRERGTRIGARAGGCIGHLERWSLQIEQCRV